MMANVKFDLVQGAVLEKAQFDTKTRVALVTDIAVGATADPLVLEKAVGALQSHAENIILNTSTHPSYPSMVLRRIRCQPEGTDAVRVFLDYTDQARMMPGTPLAYIITESSYTREVQGCFIPGIDEVVRLQWKDSTDKVLFSDNAIVRFDLTIKQIQLSAQVLGDTIPAGLDNKHNHVNDAPWEGLPKGFWKINRIQGRASRSVGYWEYDAAASTKVIEDWSVDTILFNTMTGRYVDVDNAEIATIRTAGSYTNSIRKGNGYARIGPYPLASFLSVFGF